MGEAERYIVEVLIIDSFVREYDPSYYSRGYRALDIYSTIGGIVVEQNVLSTLQVEGIHELAEAPEIVILGLDVPDNDKHPKDD
ncbi:hypothetical protein IOK49_01930 [Fervidicoccus fontis]|uniref:Uncharacterized protein n=1 Tax=Fervidicoccus fontis TaxID=683846 RepID=A0A843A9U4_9CREN|nr:hypothetical protein [Fervidicoccus fontis]MBE9390844.1 hypothetical protein [Fervidicoccus fontis]